MVARTTQSTDSIGRFDDVLARAGVRDRTMIEKHLAACEAEARPGHAQLWRRLATRLGTLAPMPVQAGPQAVLFFIRDGKYRMQVFALEDRRDGELLLYLPDVMTEALRAKVVSKNGDQYSVPGNSKHPIKLKTLDAANTTDPAPHVKHLIGWNRKAVVLTLNASEPDAQQVDAAESLCAMAATHWPAPVP